MIEPANKVRLSASQFRYLCAAGSVNGEPRLSWLSVEQEISRVIRRVRDNTDGSQYYAYEADGFIVLFRSLFSAQTRDMSDLTESFRLESENTAPVDPAQSDMFG